MGQSNTYAGYVEAVQGLTSLIVGLPVGYIADKSSKSRVIAFGALCIPLATAATVVSAVYGVADGVPAHTHTTAFLAIMIGAQVLWGTAYAVYGGTQQALMADSTPAQGRAWYYTKLNQINLVASALGPCVAIGMFVLHGDQWDILSLRNVLLAGLAIELPMCIPMLMYRDDCALEEESGEADEPAPGAAPAPVAEGAAPEGNPAQQPSGESVASGPCNHSWAVPHLLFMQDITFALGSGMTVKFFPLFFKNDMRLSPVGVQTIWLINPLLMTVFNDLAERLARRIGKISTMIGFKVATGTLIFSSLYFVVPRSMDFEVNSGPADGTDHPERARGSFSGAAGDDFHVHPLPSGSIQREVTTSTKSVYGGLSGE